jgi:cytochrome c-type biogenesis protein CcmH/NrfF
MSIIAPLAEWLGVEWLFWWQPLALLVLGALVFFLVWYRRRQM